MVQLVVKGASFNGRIAVSKTANGGSIPSAPALKISWSLSPGNFKLNWRNRTVGVKRQRQS